MRSAIKYQDKHQNEVIFVISGTHFSKHFLQKKRQSEFSEFRSVHDVSPYNQPFTFTSKEWCKSQWLAQRGLERGISETGYSYFGARYMDHELMTGWLSVDPMADKYPSISPYAYCAWNPVKLVDPDGREIDISALYDKNGKCKYKFIENALKAFAKTKLGYKELSKYAKAGQDILGVKFDKDDREIVDIINKGFDRTSIKIKQ